MKRSHSRRRRIPSGQRLLIEALLLLVALGIGATLVRHASLAGEHGKVGAKPAPKTATSRSPSAGPSATIQTARNLGKAYYEQGKYAESIAEFQKVTGSGHALATDHLDLGMALVQANNLDAALGEMTTAKQMDPKLTAIDYNLGILYKRELRYPDAEAALKHVVEADPHDPAAWFNLGDVYSAERKLPEALDTYEHVLNMGFGHGQNFYVASLFHAFTILTRLKRPAEAQKMLKIHEEFRDKVPNLSLQNPALEGGKYGAILVPPAPPTIPVAKPEPLTFADITSKLGIKLAADGNSSREGRSAAAQFPPSVAVGDYDGDGHPDLYVVIPSGTNHLFHNNGDGTFTDVTEKAGVAGPGGSVSATFADYDNSGHASLFVAGAHGVTLYRNKGGGRFADETEKAGLRSPYTELDTRAVLFDADDDGFLDLVVTVHSGGDASKPSASFPEGSPALASHFYRNNGDGTFKDLTEPSGLASAKGRMRDAVFADFNNDGYADLLFLRDDGPPLLYLNQGEGKFVEKTADAGTALAQSNAVEACVADFNHDGNFDLALWSDNGYQVLLNRGNAKFEAVEHLPAVTPPASRLAFRGTVTDLDGDGFDDLLLLDSNGKLHFIQNRGGHFVERALRFASSEPVLAYLLPAWLSNPGKLDLLSFTRQGDFSALEKQGPAPHWLEFKLDGYKSNKQGIGTVVELKSGNFYKKVEVTGDPVRVFTGDLSKLDVVRVTWPNAIVQNSIDVATNKPISVRESERLASSCPFLYVWDGRQYRFFTDILGVAPLGELLPDGSRIKPNPEDLIRLGNLRAQNGEYTFQVTDEMREVDYVDQLRLLAVDHPASEEVYSNEIYSSSPAPPALYAVSEQRIPISALDDHGHKVLPRIRELDGRYPTGFRRNRILGLADLHTLTLDLGQFPDSSRVALYLSGWVFWTDSNASRALMSNSKLQMIPPYLQVRDARGEWVTVVPDMGLPSGTRRTMRVDLTGKFLSRDHHVRIATNFCVYWDRIFFALDDRPIPTGLALGGTPSSEAEVVAKPIELPLVSADLHYRGFSTPASDPQHLRPDSFDYVHVTAHAPWNPFLGHYTRYGVVDEVVEQGDDRLVVMATGDEMTVRFSARCLPKLRAGWKRDFFLYARGYAKDGEPNTADWRTVEPLPFFTMSNYPYGPDEHSREGKQIEDYQREYETRPAHALIPPLAPAF